MSIKTLSLNTNLYTTTFLPILNVTCPLSKYFPSISIPSMSQLHNRLFKISLLQTTFIVVLLGSAAYFFIRCKVVRPKSSIYHGSNSSFKGTQPETFTDDKQQKQTTEETAFSSSNTLIPTSTGGDPFKQATQNVECEQTHFNHLTDRTAQESKEEILPLSLTTLPPTSTGGDPLDPSKQATQNVECEQTHFNHLTDRTAQDSKEEILPPSLTTLPPTSTGGDPLDPPVLSSPPQKSSKRNSKPPKIGIQNFQFMSYDPNKCRNESRYLLFQTLGDQGKRPGFTIVRPLRQNQSNKQGKKDIQWNKSQTIANKLLDLSKNWSDSQLKDADAFLKSFNAFLQKNCKLTDLNQTHQVDYFISQMWLSSESIDLFFISNSNLLQFHMITQSDGKLTSQEHLMGISPQPHEPVVDQKPQSQNKSIEIKDSCLLVIATSTILNRLEFDKKVQSSNTIDNLSKCLECYLRKEENNIGYPSAQTSKSVSTQNINPEILFGMNITFH